MSGGGRGSLVRRGLGAFALLFGVSLSVAFGVVLVSGWRAFGKRPEGERLARMQRSPEWHDEDSIAAVFSLPNGFNGYALFDAAGARVADTDVIVDQAQRDGRVRNSVSCSQCHAAGINPMTDEVRAYVEANSRDFDADTFEEALEAFRLQPEIDAVIRRDAALYESALARAGLDTAADPVSAAYVRFDGEVSLSIAAGELGVNPEILSNELGFVSSEVDGTLSSLRDQSLRREQFEALYVATLCALQVTGANRPAAAACAAVGQ